MNEVVYEPRVAHLQRNIRATVISHPKWMSEELAQALTAIIERHAIRIDGLRSGFIVDVNATAISKELAFTEVDITIPELSNFEVSETLNAWVDGAIKAQADVNASFSANAEVGLTVMFYEVNPTHTQPVRVWRLGEFFPKDTGIANAYQDLEPGMERKRDEVIDQFGTVIRPVFVFDKKGSKYNNEADRLLATELIKNGPPSMRGYAEPMKPGDVFVFSVDPHDPDPIKTIEFIKEEVKNRGVNVVILDPTVAEMLQSDEPIDFEKLKASCIQPPAEWEGTVDPEQLEKATAELELTDLKLREQRLATDTGISQSMYWNYLRELSNSVAANLPDSVLWSHGGNTVKMPKEAAELLHIKLNELGIPSANQLRDQNWQPPAFPKQNPLADSLQVAEDYVQGQGVKMVESIKIPQSLQDASNHHRVRGEDVPYGTGYQTQPSVSQPGNEIPEGWKAPHVDIDTSRHDTPGSSDTDSGSTQSSD